MAATHWHLLIAKRVVENMRASDKASPAAKLIVGFPDCFASGSLGPDVSYYPGGDAEISRLSHGVKSIDLGRAFLNLAATDREKAYAYGWWLHIVTDIVTHELINSLVAKKFYGGKIDSVAFYDDPLCHHRVEWGIDIFLLREKKMRAKIYDFATALGSGKEMGRLAKKAFRQTFDYSLSLNAWKDAADSMIRYTGLFKTIWRLSGRIAARNLTIQFFKNLLYALVVFPAARCAALRNPVAGVAIPVLQNDQNGERIKAFTRRVCDYYAVCLENNFKIVKPRPLGG